MKRLFTICFITWLGLLAGCEEAVDAKVESYTLDPTSKVEWKGSMLESFNTGTFDLQSHDITVNNNQILSGSFTIPISSITNSNLPEGPVREQLLDHLKSPDFFNILLHPTATFTITKVTPRPTSPEDPIPGLDYLIEGDFMMLGKTNSISVPARIHINDSKINTEAVFKIDRTKWGMNYASDSCLGEHYIKPEVELHLKARGRKNNEGL